MLLFELVGVACGQANRLDQMDGQSEVTVMNLLQGFQFVQR